MPLRSLSFRGDREIARMRTRSVGIDLVRAVSVIYIIGYWHLLGYSEHFVPLANGLTGRLTLVVLGLFVFVPGYLMGRKDIRLTREGLVHFYRQRILRIYTLYLIAILLFWVLGLSDGITLMKATALASMFLAPALPTLWFITMIMLYYLSVPFIRRFSHDARKLTVFCLAIMAVSLLYHKFTNMLDIRMVMFFPVFALGMYAARREAGLQPVKLVTLACICALSCVLSLLPVGSWMISQLILIPMITLCALFLFLAVQRKESGIRYGAAIQLVGYSSYCMYLFHRPLYELMKRTYLPQGPLNQLLYLTLICVPLLIGASFLIQTGYDRLLAELSGRRVGAGISLS
ncbi:MAG: acyltransferase 3 [Deltaproteobacteria bacterium]|nr:acyltransferase 3 [Deltaproteobacteria bacterium]